MTTAKFSDFLTPSPPCPHLDLIYTIKFTQPPLLRTLIHDPLPPPMRTYLMDAPLHYFKLKLLAVYFSAASVVVATKDDLRWHIIDGIVVFDNRILFSDLHSAEGNKLTCCLPSADNLPALVVRNSLLQES